MKKLLLVMFGLICALSFLTVSFAQDIKSVTESAKTTEQSTVVSKQTKKPRKPKVKKQKVSKKQKEAAVSKDKIPSNATAIKQ